MDLTDESWGAVRNTPGVTGFVGHAHQPTPLTVDEVVNILGPTVEKKAHEKTEVKVLDFQVGDSVTVIKDLKIKGASAVVKVGTKVRNIRIVSGDHDIDCKIDGIGAMQLKSEFVKKA